MSLTANPPSQELINLVGALGGTWHGRTAMCLCPAHADKTPSLSLRQGDRGILVTCFAGCERGSILRELRGIPIGRQYHYRDQPPSGRGNAERIWNEALPVSGTLAERYLAARYLLPIPTDVRFHPRCPYRPRPRTLFLPTLLIAVREGQRLTAIQRILLDAETGLYRMKLMLGRPAHGAWQGGRAGEGTLALAEGFETAQAFTLLNDLPCWATLGARRFDQILLPSAIDRLILAIDNDAEGLRAASKAEESYARPGLSIERMAPKDGLKDWAKVLEAGERRYLKPPL